MSPQASSAIDARCVKVVPYKFGEEVFVDLQQVIPTPEAADYMIRMAEKDSEERSSHGAKRRSHELRERFWQQVAKTFAAKPVSLFPSISIHNRNYNNSRSREGCGYSLILTSQAVMIRFNCDRQSPPENKFLFDHLLQHQHAIEAQVGEALNWRRMDNSRASRIELIHPCDGFDPDAWPEAADWLAEAAVRMEAALNAPLAEGLKELQAQGTR